MTHWRAYPQSLALIAADPTLQTRAGQHEVVEALESRRIHRTQGPRTNRARRWLSSRRPRGSNESVSEAIAIGDDDVSSDDGAAVDDDSLFEPRAEIDRID
jgi:hypothetical protein